MHGAKDECVHPAVITPDDLGLRSLLRLCRTLSLSPGTECDCATLVYRHVVGSGGGFGNGLLDSRLSENKSPADACCASSTLRFSSSLSIPDSPLSSNCS